MRAIDGSLDTSYVYDGGDCAQERNNAGSLTKQLVRGTGLGGGIGSILYTETSTQEREYFLYNVIGSVVATCNNDATVKSTNLYEAFGKVVASTGASDNKRLFCTKERTESIGLDNFGFRYFDWEVGRFIQRDPSGYPDGLNNYLYCSNNPINHIDPLGLNLLKTVLEKGANTVFKRSSTGRLVVDGKMIQMPKGINPGDVLNSIKTKLNWRKNIQVASNLTSMDSLILIHMLLKIKKEIQ